ncbi:MAG: polysaccharide biosynthesis C-terminal domain-containing protein, partial [Candidatus Limnocylindrales bacterium]
IPTVALGMALLVFSSAFLGLFGPGFEQGLGPLAILIVGRMIASAAGPTGTLLAMTNQERSAALGVTVGAVVEIALVLILLPILGLIGAAAASSIGIVATNLVQAVLVRRRLGLHATVAGF